MAGSIRPVVHNWWSGWWRRCEDKDDQQWPSLTWTTFAAVETVVLVGAVLALTPGAGNPSISQNESESKKKINKKKGGEKKEKETGKAFSYLELNRINSFAVHRIELVTEEYNHTHTHAMVHRPTSPIILSLWCNSWQTCYVQRNQHHFNCWTFLFSTERHDKTSYIPSRHHNVALTFNSRFILTQDRKSKYRRKSS